MKLIKFTYQTTYPITYKTNKNIKKQFIDPTPYKTNKTIKNL
jgi:hypothetical protein